MIKVVSCFDFGILGISSKLNISLLIYWNGNRKIIRKTYISYASDLSLHTGLGSKKEFDIANRRTRLNKSQDL